MKIFLSVYLCFLFTGCRPDAAMMTTDLPAKTEGVFRIAFGSCNKHNRPNHLWKHIIQSNPDVWVWLGDVIYADTKNMNRMARKYQLQKNNPDYRELLKTVPVIGVWDDHDYGKNGAYKYYSRKKESQQLFLDFIDEPADSPRRKQEGIYASYLYGNDGRQVKIILLDERYFRDRKGENASILGESQWLWLEKELTNNPAQVTLIGSSTQIVGRDHFHDCWAKFPKEEKRLFELIKQTGSKNIVVLAGDRHFGEISRFTDAPSGFPLYEITSSGMTHSKSGFWQNLFYLERNRYCIEGPFYGINFGVVDIDLEKNRIMFYVCNEYGKVQLKHEIHLSEIKPVDSSKTDWQYEQN